jgi:hypothetical protein
MKTRTLTLGQATVAQIHGMLISSVLRARNQLALAKTRPERGLWESDLSECTAALDAFSQAVALSAEHVLKSKMNTVLERTV